MDTAQKKAAAILLATQGKRQSEINAELGLHKTQLWQWRQEDHLFAEQWGRAQEDGSYAKAEELEEIARTEPNPKRASVIINAVTWRLERQHRKHWAPSVDVNMTQTLDLQGALIEARERRALLPGRNLVPALPAQATEYAVLEHSRRTDNESAAVPAQQDAPEIDPFS